MKIACAFLLLLAAAASAAVVDLTPSNFKEHVDGNTDALVAFTAPWCGHCKRMAPAFDTLAKAYEKYAGAVVIGKVDCDAHKELCGEYEVQGYPSLKWFGAGAGEPQPYNGGRDVDEFVKFVNSKTGLKARNPEARGGPAALVDLTDDTFNEVVKDAGKHVFVEFYAPWCGHCKNLEPDYIRFADAFANEQDVVIARIDADQYKEAASRFAVTGFPTLKWFPKEDKSGEEYNEGRSLEDLVQFVNSRAEKFRTPDGGLTAEAGRIVVMDDIAEDFQEGDHASALERARTEAAALTGVQARIGKVYVRVMEKIAAGETDYVEKEVQRITRMLETSAVKPAKVDEFQMRLNVLSLFA
eukprot:TRINITY_DN437_c0_g1_i3.p1 TRINITY_DN437_c0_g1~~TRINITY_DN437_c0_g1_i3.p1  ORF type:complete len:379 (-),score=160.69 TRINITY_DN437_c0_g1_i3:208-1272(-)